jgi:hypothetical protein
LKNIPRNGEYLQGIFQKNYYSAQSAKPDPGLRYTRFISENPANTIPIIGYK